MKPSVCKYFKFGCHSPKRQPRPPIPKSAIATDRDGKLDELLAVKRDWWTVSQEEALELRRDSRGETDMGSAARAENDDKR